MNQADANEIARQQCLLKAIITSDGSVYKDADPDTVKIHCEEQGLEMFLVGFDTEKEEKPSKSKKDNGLK